MLDRFEDSGATVSATILARLGAYALVEERRLAVVLLPDDMLDKADEGSTWQMQVVDRVGAS